MTKQASTIAKSNKKSKSPRSQHAKSLKNKINHRSNSTEMITVKNNNNLMTNFSNMQNYQPSDKLIRQKTLSSFVLKNQDYSKLKNLSQPLHSAAKDNIERDSIKLPNLQLLTSINRKIPRIKLDFSNIILMDK